MSAVFSSTTDALANDPYHRRALLGLIVSLVLMIAWVIWFLFGAIHHYVNSVSATIQRQEQPVWRIPEGENTPIAFQRFLVEAHFLPEDMKQIRTGQDAAVYFADQNTIPSRPFLTTVKAVNRSSGTVLLLIEKNEKKGAGNANVQLQSPRVEIAVYSESPAAFLLHTVTHHKVRVVPGTISAD